MSSSSLSLEHSLDAPPDQHLKKLIREALGELVLLKDLAVHGCIRFEAVDGRRRGEDVVEEGGAGEFKYLE